MSGATSYDVARDGTLTANGGPVSSGQAAACWLAAAGHFAYTTNAASGSIGRFAIAPDGSLSHLGTTVIGAGSTPLDNTVTHDQQFMYVLLAGSHQIVGYRVGADGSTPPVAVVSSVKDKYAAAVSPDGAHVVFGEEWAGAARVMVAPVDGGARGRSVTDSSTYSVDPALSPDGRWIAYNEGPSASERSIVVRRADGTGAKLQVSARGGSLMPRWSKGGREIVFRRRNAVYAVDVDVASGHVGEERQLFDGSYPAELGYDVMADGSRFLMVRADARPEALPILVITNFFDEVRKKVGP